MTEQVKWSLSSARAWRMLHVECLSRCTCARQSCDVWSCCVTSSVCLWHTSVGSGSCFFWPVLLKVCSLSLPHVVISMIDAWFTRKKKVQLMCLPVTTRVLAGHHSMRFLFHHPFVVLSFRLTLKAHIFFFSGWSGFFFFVNVFRHVSGVWHLELTINCIYLLAALSNQVITSQITGVLEVF